MCRVTKSASPIIAIIVSFSHLCTHMYVAIRKYTYSISSCHLQLQTLATCQLKSHCACSYTVVVITRWSENLQPCELLIYQGFVNSECKQWQLSNTYCSSYSMTIHAKHVHVGCREAFQHYLVQLFGSQNSYYPLNSYSYTARSQIPSRIPCGFRSTTGTDKHVIHTRTHIALLQQLQTTYVNVLSPHARVA